MAINSIESAAQGHGITQGLPASKMSATRSGNAIHFRDIGKLAVACRTCATRSSCRATRLWAADHGLADTPSLSLRVFKPGQHVFYNGDLNEVVSTVRSGSFKTCLSTGSNDEQVVNFHLPGEVLDINAVATGRHGLSAVALETASVCEAPLTELQNHGGGSRGLLFKLLGEELNRVRHMMLIIAKKDAELRVASFLCNLSLRLQARGLSARAFNLSMSRQDIGNHLGLTIETVSRVLRHLQQDGLLEVNRRRITIRNLNTLGNMAGDTLQGRINRE
jgi:CRP/FNR family transcriptional regulator